MGESDNVGPSGSSDGAAASTPRSIDSTKDLNIFVSAFRSVFGYRKTTLTLLVFTLMIATVILSSLDNCLKFGIDMPSGYEEEVLFKSWSDLQLISSKKHTYASVANDEVHDYLEKTITNAIGNISYIEYDNDLDNNIIFSNDYLDYSSVNYYESNNLLVRINGSNSKLPALLLSAHYDSVPTSYGVTDDGMGIASLLGVLYHYVQAKQPARTIIFNFNNNEEFGLYGANAFLNHPWFKQLGYFLNLEGTGAGGKAILFRGTDYGIVNHFKAVRYPYGTSIFQQGFNNHLIHSETDYKVYFEQGGLRGLDLAFYKPRDLYHTDGDNLANINIKSLWHMLSNSLDFVEAFVAGKVDLDDTEDEPELAVYTSFFNHFFALPISKLILVNSILLAIFPLVTIFLLVVVFHYKKNWQLNSINVWKFPISLGLSILLLNFVSKTFAKLNQFLPNSSFNLIFITLFSMFIFLNYVILNLINLIFKNYKVTNHDEKLIVMLEISMIYWAALLWSTIKLGYNRFGDDHTGEFPILIVFLLQAIAVIFGLLGWSFRPARRDTQDDGSEEAEPLLRSDEDDYGSREDDDARSDATSTISDINDGKIAQFIKTYSYDWSLQFLIIVPVSSYVIYNSGFLILDGISKSIQESMIAEKMIYGIIELFVLAWALPYLPFVFKLNKLIILSLILIIVSGIISIGINDAFDSSNPLKLRFVQTIDLDKSVKDTVVEVYGRSNTPMEQILQDLPSVKSGKKLKCSNIADGMEQCNYSSTLIPEFLPGKSFEDYLKIDILKNSSNSGSYGLLLGEIQINVPKNRYCMLKFENQKQDVESYDYYKDKPVKTVIVYRDVPKKNGEVDITGIPEGFSTDKNGNYIFKKLNGINEFQLNKLNWDVPYHIGFQWVPNILDENDAQDEGRKQLGVSIKCHWTDLAPVSVGHQVYDPIPVYSELLHYSPNYVSWANKEKGLVSITKHIKV